MWINYIHFYVEDAEKWRDWFVTNMGFQAIASRNDGSTLTEIISTNKITFVVSSALTLSSPVSQYFLNHSSGIIDLAFLVPNLDKIVTLANKQKAKFSHPLQVNIQTNRKWCQIVNPVGFKHTLVEGKDDSQFIFPSVDLLPLSPVTNTNHLFSHLDHLVLNVGKGKLKKVVDWYQTIFGFQPQQTFEIATENSALSSQVMVHPDTGVQLPINEPIDDNSQVQEFINFNGGAGIQHLALGTSNIIAATSHLKAFGVSFLNIPDEYYEYLPSLDLLSVEYQQLKNLGILIESQSKTLEGWQPLLLQIFTQPIFSVPTFFFELIERRHHAKGFGDGNFQALFEAIEREQLKRVIK